MNLWSTRALFVRTTAGAIGTRLSLRPLFSKEGEVDANLGRIVPREHERMSFVIPGWCVSTRPQMCNRTLGNLEIPGSMLRIAPE